MSRWVAAMALSAALAGCASNGAFERAFQPGIYVVRSGDTVYSIAWRYRVDPQDLIAWNDIGDPRGLQPGTRLRLHPRRTHAPSPSMATASTHTGADQGSTIAASAGPSTPDSAPSGTGAAGSEDWRWPTTGRVVGTFRDGRVAGHGVDIEGEYGQPVQATAAGEVVYSGKGLQAYGRLIIIRHDSEYLSAYAHNSELLVREGERVTGGQQIGRMGRGNDGRPVLHFEIRREGKPVDPLDYLPPRDQANQ